LDVLLISAERRSFSSCVSGIHVSVVGRILTVWVTKGAATAPRIARESATFHCFMANHPGKTQATLQHLRQFRTIRPAPVIHHVCLLLSLCSTASNLIFVGPRSNFFTRWRRL